MFRIGNRYLKSRARNRYLMNQFLDEPAHRAKREPKKHKVVHQWPRARFQSLLRFSLRSRLLVDQYLLLGHSLRSRNTMNYNLFLGLSLHLRSASQPLDVSKISDLWNVKKSLICKSIPLPISGWTADPWDRTSKNGITKFVWVIATFRNAIVLGSTSGIIRNVPNETTVYAKWYYCIWKLKLMGTWTLRKLELIIYIFVLFDRIFGIRCTTEDMQMCVTPTSTSMPQLPKFSLPDFNLWL